MYYRSLCNNVENCVPNVKSRIENLYNLEIGIGYDTLDYCLAGHRKCNSNVIKQAYEFCVWLSIVVASLNTLCGTNCRCFPGNNDHRCCFISWRATKGWGLDLDKVHMQKGAIAVSRKRIDNIRSKEGYSEHRRGAKDANDNGDLGKDSLLVVIASEALLPSYDTNQVQRKAHSIGIPLPPSNAVHCKPDIWIIIGLESYLIEHQLVRPGAPSCLCNGSIELYNHVTVRFFRSTLARSYLGHDDWKELQYEDFSTFKMYNTNCCRSIVVEVEEQDSSAGVEQITWYALAYEPFMSVLAMSSYAYQNAGNLWWLNRLNQYGYRVEKIAFDLCRNFDELVQFFENVIRRAIEDLGIELG